jgi:hypothetical protein
MNTPSGFRVWYRYAKPSEWFPLFLDPKPRDDCDVDAELLGELEGIASVLILPWGKVPDPEQ